MYFARLLLTTFFANFFVLPAVASSPLVTGNGFGFAVVSPTNATVTKFYAHPYSFARPDPHDPLGEGIETANFIKGLNWVEGNEAVPTASGDYMEDSHIVRARSRSGEGFFFMPFGLRKTALIIAWESVHVSASSGRFRVEWSHPLKSQRVIRKSGVEAELLTFDGIEERLVLIPLAPTIQGHIETTQSEKLLSGSRAWALISLDSDEELEGTLSEFARWHNKLGPKALVKRELAQLERWRVRPDTHFRDEKERHLWRQSEVVLRMGQSREPNRPGRYNNGLIVACLPDGSWFMPWVRDMAYAAVALARMGHRHEARAALLAYFNARPTGKMRKETGGADYQISVVRYFGDGSEEPFFTMEGSTNIEYDNWGLVLWVMGEYLQRFRDPAVLKVPTYRGRLYESARDYVVKPLLANLEKYEDGLIVAADTSIWEERQRDKKHFAFSTAAAMVGLQNFAGTAQLVRDERTRRNVLKHVALLRRGFEQAFVRQGTLRGTLEEGIKNDIDGALLSVINFGVVQDTGILRSTVDRMELLKVASGGYRRVRCVLTDPSIYEYWYERQEFLFVDFNLAEVLRRLGRHDQANGILNRIVDKAAGDHNFIPEMYVAERCRLFHGELGDPTGAIPMVGYGAGVYVLHLLQR